jgi:hypothetical protein
MRRYDDPVEVRRGMVDGPGGRQEGPEQFLWRGRLWKVRDVVAHWVETGPWWQSADVHAVLGAGDAPGAQGATRAPGATATVTAGVRADLLAEREVWRVEASRGLAATHAAGGPGLFDLVFDWADGTWALTRCDD